MHTHHIDRAVDPEGVEDSVQVEAGNPLQTAVSPGMHVVDAGGFDGSCYGKRELAVDLGHFHATAHETATGFRGTSI